MSQMIYPVCCHRFFQIFRLQQDAVEYGHFNKFQEQGLNLEFDPTSTERNIMDDWHNFDGLVSADYFTNMAKLSK